MCTYGIGLPFDQPIWLAIPRCRCGTETETPMDVPDGTQSAEWRPTHTVRVKGHYCPLCGQWHSDEQITYTTTDTTWSLP